MPRGRKAGKPVAEINLEQAFFRYLTAFYRDNRGTIRKSYRVLTREFLDWNDREKRPGAFLRPPQFEALEIYVFLKEYVGNQPVHRIFNDWYHRTGRFADRAALGLTAEEEAQTLLFTVEQAIEKAAYEKLYAAMKAAADINTEGMGPGFPNPPPNYIFALTMGTGKTLLMATCLLYEFLLAHKFPKDDKYAHNALVFAPDTTVRESLREIETFDHSLLLPPEHARVLLPLLRFQVLGDGETNLALLDGSDFNVVISNAQKIILRRQHQAPTAGQQLFRPEELSGGHARAHALLASGTPQSDAELTVNQRFQKLCRLKHLAVYIDEAHHAFGKALAKDLGQAGERAEDKSSFRLTVETLIRELDARGSRVIGTFCYTGTPYADGQLFPEVVYAYGLNEAIKTRLLK
ncbi:MAG: type III restriction endonuclease, partial [Myxococcota bacterium]